KTLIAKAVANSLAQRRGGENTRSYFLNIKGPELLEAAAVESLIERCVEEMYAETDRNRFVEVTYANGRREMLYFAEFTSGAMISNVVDRAKKHAIKAYLDLGEHGI
ncbi:hypothetical protein CJ199_16025, partial [Brevibacterium paucivorans]